jgi:type VI secretion system protein ImpG
MTRDELLLYYERELRFIRKLATGFAEKYPEVAGRLLLEPTKCEDPHVERLIEAFAMLTARVHQRLDSDLSEISDALLGILYPHYLAPVPSATIVQFRVDPSAGAVEGGFRVDAHSLLHSRPVAGVRCGFRTTYPLRLFPLEVAEVELVSAASLRPFVPADVQSALRIALRTAGGIPVSSLAIDALRFFLDAASGDIHALYELFLRDPAGVLVRADADTPGVLLPADRIRPVGFARDEGLFEYPTESFIGYRLLQEYFSFPDKFLFVELADLAAGTKRCEGETLELFVLQRQSPAQLELRVERDHLKLGCTPAVNLFPHHADPIRLTQTSVEYPIQPDARAPDAYEVHTVRSVSASTPAAGIAESRTYAPFYGIRHGSADAGGGAYWHAVRRASLRKGDSGTDVFLSLVDSDFDMLAPPTDVLHVEVLCTNRGLPALVPFGDPRGDFQLEGRPGITSIAALRKPTDPLPAPIGSASRWRLISHLTLNYLSITGAANGRAAGGDGNALAALREILRLYDFDDSAVTRQRIAGLVGLRTRPVVRRAGRGSAAAFARGIETELEFDPAQYTGTGVFLFASVLERFLGLYTSVNSFTQTVARVRQRPGELKRWPPRAGEIQLL